MGYGKDQDQLTLDGLLDGSAPEPLARTDRHQKKPNLSRGNKEDTKGKKMGKGRPPLDSLNLFANTDNPVVAESAYEAIAKIEAIAEDRVREVQRKLGMLVNEYEARARSASKDGKYWRRLKMQMSPRPGIDKPLVYLRWRSEWYVRAQEDPGQKPKSKLNTKHVPRGRTGTWLDKLFTTPANLRRHARKEEYLLIEWAEKNRAILMLELTEAKRFKTMAARMRAKLQEAQLTCIAYTIDKEKLKAQALSVKTARWNSEDGEDDEDHDS
jgi:hypothetical protein